MADAGGQPPGCRLQLLEQLVLNTQTQNSGEIQIQDFSYETLLDLLELLHSELSGSNLKGEKAPFFNYMNSIEKNFAF